jgi:hypothetical protein
LIKFLLREPLIHFLIIGGALFLLFGLFNNPAGPQSGRIVITAGKINYLKANFTRTWQRPPVEKELQGLIDTYVRDEIFYREAFAMGLNKDDSVIRRRLKQKLEIMSDDMAGLAMPSDEELRQFMESHPESFRSEPQAAFRHIFINTDQRGTAAINEAGRLLALLSDEENRTDPDTLGDSLMLPKSFDLSTLSQIARHFGESFSLEIMKIKPGHWAGPIRSGYGLHLVRVNQQIEGRLPELAEVREVVEREWLVVHSKELKEGIYQKLREKYTVVFEQSDDKGVSVLPVTEARAALEGQR